MQLEVILPYFANYIENELGIVYADHNYFQLQNRLEQIASLLNFGSLQNLYDHAQKYGFNGPLRKLLLDLATNNETSFFRDMKVFQSIEGQVLPALLEKYPHQKIRIWSAASSTGQEALSISMLFLEASIKRNKVIDFEVLGTDISERVLERAKTGEYSQLEVQRGLSQELANKYFRKNENDRFVANRELMSLISYQSLNLKNEFKFREGFDVVFCRNVLIYQSVAGKIDILKRISTTVRPGGYLILGAGESLLGLSEDYEQMVTSGTVLYRRKGIF